MNGQLTIIHFGHQVGEHIINHHIPQTLWKSAFDQICQSKIWTHRRLDQTIQSYQLENCVYELDILNGQIFSYIPTYSSIEFKTNPKLASFNTYLQYQVASQTLSDQSFQPITKYYNTTKVQRSEFGDSKVTFIFDQKENHFEIMILHWLEQDEDALLPYLDLLSSIK